MYIIISTVSHLLDVKTFKQSIAKYRLSNIFIVLVILFSSSASFRTKTVSAASNNYQDGKLADYGLPYRQNVMGIHPSEGISFSGMNGQGKLALKRSDALACFYSIANTCRAMTSL